jgi:hypothetical protein
LRLRDTVKVIATGIARGLIRPIRALFGKIEKVGDVHEIMNFFLIGAIFKRSDLTYLRAGRMRR